MIRMRFVAAILGLGLVGAVIPGCDWVFRLTVPCNDRVFDRDGHLRYDSGLLDGGGWSLVEVDGKPIPSGGLPIPGNPNALRVLRGTFFFETDWPGWSDDCKTLHRSRGTVTAYYVTMDTLHVHQKESYYTGKFFRDHDTSLLRLTAGDRVLDAVATSTQFTATGEISALGPGVHTVKFIRGFF